MSQYNDLVRHEFGNRQYVTRRRDGGVSFRLIMASRYTVWQNVLPFLKRLW